MKLQLSSSTKKTATAFIYTNTRKEYNQSITQSINQFYLGV